MAGPDTKYKMMWRGEWRPVTHMLDMSNTQTTLALRATRAVLFIDGDIDGSEDGFVATACTTADLFERTDRDVEGRNWEDALEDEDDDED